MDNTYTVTVFNTITSEYEEVSVDKAVYDELRRGEWRIQKNDEKHSSNEIPFSSLLGGEKGEYENFHEFVSDENNPLLQLLEMEEAPNLHKVIRQLNEDDRLLIESIYFKGMSEKEFAERQGIRQQTIHKKKARIIKKLEKFLGDGC